MLIRSVALAGLLAFAGCLDQQAPDAAPGSGEALPGPTVHTTAVAFQGYTSHDACTTTTTPLCFFVEAGRGEVHEITIGDVAALRVVGNLTWDAASPATETLTMFLIVDDHFEEHYPHVEGRSPLSIDFDLTGFPGKNLALGVSANRCSCAGGAGIEHTLPQEFAFRGEFTATVDGPGTRTP